MNSLKQKKKKKKKKKSSYIPTLNEFYDFFKSLNAGEEQDSETSPRNHDYNNEFLNIEISRDEILLAIKKLKNAKASGMDLIINGHIKATKNVLLPIYYKLFNVILNTGHFP